MGLSHKVLIVDDQEEVRNLIFMLLSRHEHYCETAKDGVEAFERIKNHSFDAVVTDIEMPHMDGICLTRELIQLYPNLSIMVMTGYPLEHPTESAVTAGARELIKKPFTMDEFIMCFDKMMGDR